MFLSLLPFYFSILEYSSNYTGKIMTDTPAGRLSESAAVEQVIEAISADSARLKARDETESIFFQMKAAKALGYEEPLTAEQRAMNTILTKFVAGNACCEQAWTLYHKLTTAP